MVIKLKSGKYRILEDTHINVIMESGIEYNDVRFIGTDRTATVIRCITRGQGMNEFPIAGIKRIEETNPGIYRNVQKI